MRCQERHLLLMHCLERHLPLLLLHCLERHLLLLLLHCLERHLLLLLLLHCLERHCFVVVIGTLLTSATTCSPSSSLPLTSAATCSSSSTLPSARIGATGLLKRRASALEVLTTLRSRIKSNPLPSRAWASGTPARPCFLSPRGLSLFRGRSFIPTCAVFSCFHPSTVHLLRRRGFIFLMAANGKSLVKLSAKARYRMVIWACSRCGCRNKVFYALYFIVSHADCLWQEMKKILGLEVFLTSLTVSGLAHLPRNDISSPGRRFR